MSTATLNPTARHPCFNESAHFNIGRIHLPVAPKCNVKCNYCRRAKNATENRPGVCVRIISPLEALALTRRVISASPEIKIIGIAGPGDALANETTFETLSLVHREFPRLSKCVSTNGLLLYNRVPDLLAVGVNSVSVTVNAVDDRVGRAFYEKVYFGRAIHGPEAFKILSARQLAGIKEAAGQGISVKVNSVLVPALNGEHLLDVAHTVAGLGASLMNIMPLKPMSAMASYSPPDCVELETIRARCERIIPQFKLCRQCRADAIGIPGLNKC